MVSVPVTGIVPETVDDICNEIYLFYLKTSQIKRKENIFYDG
jgi:hypothetical protein